MKKILDQSVILKSIGVYSPKRILTNNDLSNFVDTSDEWIFTRTGIRERRVASKFEKPSEKTTDSLNIQIHPGVPPELKKQRRVLRIIAHVITKTCSTLFRRPKGGVGCEALSSI